MSEKELSLQELIDYRWDVLRKQDKQIDRQKRTIKLMAALLILQIIVMAMSGMEQQRRQNIIDSQDALIKTSEARITNLVDRVKELEQEADNKALEDAVTSRGAQRTATITAYTYTGNKTASGTWPKEGRTVAGPRNVPFGTMVWIDGIGERIVEDRTHERYDGRYDVYMDSKAECLKWGIQERVVR